MKELRLIVMLAISLLFAVQSGAAEDTRTKVDLPDMMKSHMLGNMRDHLASLQKIQAALAKGKLEEAGDIAESRIGMSSLESHGASHLAPYMPKAMQAIGTEMHHAASRFAMTVSEGDMSRSLEALSKVTEQCVACHSSYRVN